MSAIVLLCVASVSAAEKFFLLTGVDARHYPGTGRYVSPDPGPGYPGTFYDGDRLAGTSDVGPQVNYVGVPPQPFFEPNQFGSVSFLYRRGSVPLGPSGVLPFLGIEFLGGPLLDLDGDLENGVRSLVPVDGATAVTIPETESFVSFDVDKNAGEIRLVDFDATGNNEGGPGIGPDIATILVTIAGTGNAGEKGEPANPDWDKRVGTLTQFTGRDESLRTTYAVSDLKFEIWEDTIDPNSATAGVLGTMQFLGSLRGYYIERDSALGDEFPKLAGQDLGSTLWPLVDTSQVDNVFKTANDLGDGTATIRGGNSKDNFAVTGNGGVALQDHDGDLGAYLDNVVVPLLSADVRAFVYLEAAGFGINNSNDPVFTDTIGYDVVIVAAVRGCAKDARCDANCDGLVNFDDIDCFVAALIGEDTWRACGLIGDGCNFRCQNDTNGDGAVDFNDIDAFVECLIG